MIAIGAVFVYYTIMAVLIAAGCVFAMIGGASLLIYDAYGPIAGLITFVMLTGLTILVFNNLGNDTDHKGARLT
jgi:Flp pilus assembly pilin Flp